jgi:hypothetical protein
MSKIEVNEISKTSTANEITFSSPVTINDTVTMGSPLKIKSYQTSELSGLTPSTGEIIFDTDVSKLKVYTGSAWEEVGSSLDLSALDQSIIPDTDVTYDLGSTTYKFRDLYLSGSSINLGDQTITSDSRSISLSGSLKLKQYTSSQIDALTGTTKGEMVYDTDSSQIKVHNGSDFLSVVATAGVEASGGDTTQTYTDGGVDYKSHIFTSSGTFQVTSATAGSTVDILLVAGGGAGGADNAGGGGAGGMIVQAGLAVSQQNYSIVIGNGGAKSTSTDGNGAAATAGDDTTAFGYTAIGGGQGGSAGSANNAGDGGSGGGLQGAEQSGTAGSGTSGQGNDGGGSSGSGGGGGGGGAGAAGQTVTGTTGGTGGVGLQNNYADGTNTYYAGGGAGGNENGLNANVAGGSGGGASSPGADGTPSDGTANSGGGGAGGTHTGNLGSNGGKGVVVIRYQV